MSERKLASVQIIAEKKPINGADLAFLIEAVRVNDKWVIVEKGEFKESDYCIYFEIDSFLPIRPEFEFLRKSSFVSTEHLGDGFRLKSFKLKGQISQGLAIPFSLLSQTIWMPRLQGTDVTELLGVKEWK